jgi:hypothetical protein
MALSVARRPFRAMPTPMQVSLSGFVVVLPSTKAMEWRNKKEANIYQLLHIRYLKKKMI